MSSLASTSAPHPPIHLDNPLRRYLHSSGVTPKGSRSAPYALVTGTTGGMGEEWAKQLASLGFNIILQGRNRTKLQKVQSAIALATPSVQTRLLVTEATVYPNQDLTAQLTALLDDPEVRLTVVINNLGTSTTSFPRLEEETTDSLASVIISNCIFPAEVTRIALPHLKRNQPALLAVISSLGVYASPPYVSPYIGTKGFDLGFSQALYNEMAAEDCQVDVTCIIPGQVISGMHHGPESLLVPTSENWTRAAIQNLRPTWWNPRPSLILVPHRWQYWATLITTWLPPALTRKIAITMGKGLREEARKGR